MNFLALCQQARHECGYAGQSGTPSTVINQTGQLKHIVDWVKNGWMEIQNRHPSWRWMRKGFTLQTVAGDGTYAYGDCLDTETSAAITRFKSWWAHDNKSPFTIYLTSAGVAGERELHYLPWDEFKRMYRRGTQNNGQPSRVSVDDNNQLVIGPLPDGIYTINGEYQRSAQVLALDADTPELPTDYHMLLVYRAMRKYSVQQSAPEVYDGAKMDADLLMRQLEQNQLPSMQMAGPMA